MDIPNAAVEAAARNMFDLRVIELDQSPTEWDELPEPWQDEWRDGARAAIEAAAPHIVETTEVAVRERVARDIETARSQAPAWVAESHLPAWQAALAAAARIARGEQP